MHLNKKFLIVSGFVLFSGPMSAQDPDLILSWRDRAAAYKKVISDPTWLNDPDKQALLLRFQERENKLLNKEDPNPGDAFDSEQYGEDLNILGEAIIKIAEKTGDQQAFEVLLSSGYNPDSELGNMLASRYEDLPTLLQMANSPSFVTRGNAAYMLGTMLQHSKQSESKLNPSLAAKAKAAVIQAAANDQEVFVRRYGVQSLGRIGDKSDAALLQQIAVQDPAKDRTPDGRILYPVRDAARKAMSTLNAQSTQMETK